MFADVANFTSLSEKLDPEEVHQIMDGCFKILMDEIHKYEGTINQFTGDGVMALFGAPVAHEDHAQRASHAAISIQKAIGEYGEKVARDFGVEFKMRIGLNSGPVIVGAIGDDLRMDYTAVGDTTNLASRMQTMAQPGTVLLSKNTHRLVKEYFELKPLGKLEVKGKEELQEVFELTKAAGATSRLEASVVRGLTKFVGRHHSMAALMEAFEKVRNGTGQVVGVVGEAGVGKSRLLLEFRHRPPQGEFGYLEGRCIHYGGSMPYLPIFEVGEGEREAVIRKRVKERIINLDEKLQGVVPPILDLLSLKVEDEAYLKLEPRQRKEKVFEALRDLIVRGSHERPLVIAVEDLHWIDKTSEEFLDYFIGWLATVKVMLILLHRPEYTHRWGSKSYFNRIGLDQLTLKSSAELVKAILEGGETAPELNELILNRAAGNPLFMEELTHSLLENGSIQMKDKQYVLARKASDLQVPDTIQGIIAARIDRLEENLKRIMQVASVIGREFAFRILQAISEMREDLKSQLLNLQGLELIYEKSLFPELEYIFKHALTQEVAYNSLLSNRRKEIHEKIGAAIEQLYPDRLQDFYEMLAYHYARAEAPDKAYQYLKLSAQKATRNNAVSESFRFYTEAVRTLKRLPESEDNKRELIRLIISMDTPMRFLAYPEQCLKYFQEGERASKELGDEGSLATFYSLMGIYYTYRGDPLRGMDYSEKCIREAMKHEDVDLIAPMAMDLCVAYEMSGDQLKTIDLAPYVIELLEKKKREGEFFDRSFHPYSSLQLYYGLSLAYCGRYDGGKAVFEEALASSLKVRHLATLSAAELFFSIYFCLMGEGKEALKHAQESLRYSQEGNVPFMSAFAYLFLGYSYLVSNQPETALKHAQKGYTIATETGLVLGSAVFPLWLGDIHFDLGNLEESEKYMQEAKELSGRIHCKQWHAYAKMYLGRIWSRRDLSLRTSAEEYILDGMGVLEGLGLKLFLPQAHLFLGELYALTGEHEKALKHLSEAEKGFQKMGPAGNQYCLRQTRKAVERVRG
jgi:class 3 adenylate cyclase/tetratricopeptide (TPR) repeat protein